MSLDAWTSSNGYGFLAIVLHYITEDWCLDKHLCCCNAIDNWSLHRRNFDRFPRDYQRTFWWKFGPCVWQTLELHGLKGHVSTYSLPASYAIALIPHRLLLLTVTILQTMTPWWKSLNVLHKIEGLELYAPYSASICDGGESIFQCIVQYLIKYNLFL